MTVTCPLCNSKVLVEDRTKPASLTKHYLAIETPPPEMSLSEAVSMVVLGRVPGKPDLALPAPPKLAIRCPASFAEIEAVG